MLRDFDEKLQRHTTTRFDIKKISFKLLFLIVFLAENIHETITLLTQNTAFEKRFEINAEKILLLSTMGEGKFLLQIARHFFPGILIKERYGI